MPVNATPEPAGILLAPTPARWFDVACERWRELLIDHANCEKKAASTALSLIFTYPEDFQLTERLSRLAREELRHFEQVQKLMRELEVPFMRLSPSRYAEGLRRALRVKEPERLLDLLLCGALIEARSCERFVGLAPRLAQPMGGFYAGLAQSEARHQGLYLRLAEPQGGRCRLARPVASDRGSGSGARDVADPQFRFHSGEPVDERRGLQADFAVSQAEA